MDYDNIFEVLNKIKPIKMLGNTEFVTVQMTAEYYEVGYQTINSLIFDNREELDKNGLLTLKGKESRAFLSNNNIEFNNTRGGFLTLDGFYRFSNNKNIFISKRVLTIIGILLNDSRISVELKRKIGIGTRLLPRKEIEFLNQLEESLKPFNIKGEKQYSILSYRIDYYIPSLNIAIEYDENDHDNYTYEQHEGRQKEIERELGCKFIRISDKNTNEYNIGYVIKNIFNL